MSYVHIIIAYTQLCADLCCAALVNAFRFTVANSAAAPAWAAGKTLEVCTSRKSDKQEWLEALVQTQQRTAP